MVVKKGFHTGHKISKNFKAGGLVKSIFDLSVLANQKKSIWIKDIGIKPAAFFKRLPPEYLSEIIRKGNVYKTEKIVPGDMSWVFEGAEPLKLPCMESLIVDNPPLGVMRKEIWEEMRIDDLKQAIRRRLEANYTIPVEWVEELNNYLKK